MKLRKAIWLVAGSALMHLPGAMAVDGARGRFDGNWDTHMACEAHGETPAYAWDFTSTIKDNNFHGTHGEEGGPGYLVIDGPIGSDGSAKLSAKGTVTKNHAHGVFAMRGNNYSYIIKAQFTGTKGSGTRDEGAGILGRSCTFDFTKQGDDAQSSPANGN